jgi:hypothetical protein
MSAAAALNACVFLIVVVEKMVRRSRSRSCNYSLLPKREAGDTPRGGSIPIKMGDVVAALEGMLVGDVVSRCHRSVLCPKRE